MASLRWLLVLLALGARANAQESTESDPASADASRATRSLAADVSTPPTAKFEFPHLQAECELGDCASGGCIFERCTAPVTCTGGLCVFKRCKKAVCEGGGCTFDGTEHSSCPGGGCHFKNVARTLQEGYCTGGACMLEGEPHPTKLSETLSA